MADPVVNAAPAVEEAAAPTPAVELKPKNTHRLNRIFRKPKSSVAARQWRVVVAPAEENEEAAAKPSAGNRRSINGVSLQAIRAAVGALSESEKARAAAKEDPLSATQEELARRAERFGILVAPAGGVAPVVADPAVLRAREERFGPVTAGVLPQPQLTEEDRAAMEARAKRFGS